MKYGFKDGKNAVEMYSKAETQTYVTGEIGTAVATINTNKQDKAVSATATLAAASWSLQTQTVNVPGVTATNIVIVSPAPADSDKYTAASIVCTGQAANALTFTCKDTPTSDIDVNVVIL